jgi:hypothetical protein
LGHGEAADGTILGSGAEAGDFEILFDPLHDLIALSGGGLGEALGRHGPFADTVKNAFPDADVALVEGGVEMVNADAGGEVVAVVAGGAILFEEGFNGGFKFGRLGGSANQKE